MLVSEETAAFNKLFKTYAMYSCILLMKLLLMPLLTLRQRMRREAFLNPEDATGYGKVQVEENVERVRRAHQNDMENIPLFLFVSGLYLFTNPMVETVTTLFRLYTALRILHTFTYLWAVQPARTLSWCVSYSLTAYMAFNTFTYFLTAT